MGGHIVQPVNHHHVCNIDGIGNFYGLDIASSMTAGSEIISVMAMTTSALIIAIVIIIIASVGGIKLSAVALVLASLIILLSPSPILGSSVWFPTTILTPIGSMAFIVISIIFIMIVIVYIFILLFLLTGEGEVIETAVVVWIYLYLSFLLYLLCFGMVWVNWLSLDLGIVLCVNISWEQPL